MSEVSYKEAFDNYMRDSEDSELSFIDVLENVLIPKTIKESIIHEINIRTIKSIYEKRKKGKKYKLFRKKVSIFTKSIK